MYNFYTFKHDLTKKNKNGINIYSRFEDGVGHYGCFYHVILRFDSPWKKYKNEYMAYTIFLNKFPANIKNNIKKAVESVLSSNGDLIIYQPGERNMYSYLDLVFQLHPEVAVMNVINDIKLKTHKIIVSDKFGKQYYNNLNKEIEFYTTDSCGNKVHFIKNRFSHKTVWSQDTYIETVGKIKINGPFK